MSDAASAPAGTVGHDGRWLAFVESNTTGTGRAFCAAAQARGLRPVLLTRDPGRYRYVSDDHIDTRILDTGDLSSVHEACAALIADGGLAGVTSSSEYFVATAARAAAKAGLPSADGDAIDRCRAKDLQRAALKAGRVAIPRFLAADDASQAVRAADAIGYPVVLKPVNGSGSVGVRLCRDRGEVRWWASEVLNRAIGQRGGPGRARILVEEAITGPEFSVETFDEVVIAVVAKETGPEPYFVETGHQVPAPVADSIAATLRDTARRALRALGLGWGAAHTEVRLSSRGPVVIEVNPRLAGGMIPVAVKAAIGVDSVDAVIARATGSSPMLAASATGHAVVRFLRADRQGRVVAIDGIEAATATPGVVAVTVSTAVGEAVRITHSFKDRLCCVVAADPDVGLAGKRAAAAMRLVTIRLDDLAAPEEAMPE